MFDHRPVTEGSEGLSAKAGRCESGGDDAKRTLHPLLPGVAGKFRCGDAEW
jgi:hypothetical protein